MAKIFLQGLLKLERTSMRIAPININSQKYQNKNSTISFEAMKKADFRGIDYAVVEKFKAPMKNLTF